MDSSTGTTTTKIQC